MLASGVVVRVWRWVALAAYGALRPVCLSWLPAAWPWVRTVLASGVVVWVSRWVALGAYGACVWRGGLGFALGGLGCVRCLRLAWWSGFAAGGPRARTVIASRAPVLGFPPRGIGLAARSASHATVSVFRDLVHQEGETLYSFAFS
ncbi:hypothetical protein GCM10027176_84720 [Actinoallomurus bryophytorum]